MKPFFFILLTLLLAGCAGAAATLTPTPKPDQSAIRAAWTRSPHGNTYDLGKGPNTYCSKCHSPRNWSPAAKIDPAPNCVSCKFDFDPAVRRAEHNVLVAKSDWHDVGCDVCHQMTDGVATPALAWWDQAAGAYTPVADSNALCSKCHTDTETIRHQITLGTSTHKDFQCTACHDAHSTQASCTQSGCHTVNLASSTTPGHDTTHKNVTCAACHDAGALQVGPAPDGKWTTFQTTELLGRKTTKALPSHNLARAAPCARCHYASNPWGLATSVK